MAPERTGAGAAVRARLMLALALASVLSGPPAAACPTKCTCSAASVDCHGLGLRAVPRGIPRNAERLDLDRNNITRITKTDFAGLKNLRVLHLEDNQVSVIERGAFQDLKQLERLRLNKNKLQVLPELLFQSNLKLTRLDLSENQILGIPRKAFRGIADVKNLPQEQKVLRVCKLKHYGQGLLFHPDVHPEQQGSRGTGEANKLTA